METEKTYRVLLAGNPNCGKTSLFNQLTGTRQHVGNYPGVTVESKSGNFEIDGLKIELVDLPGIYSMASKSPEERVSFNELIAKGVDLILNVVDCTILQRSLFFTAQLAELHIPMLIAMNMSDDAQRKGLSFDIPMLERYFGAKVVPTVGTNQDGIKVLLSTLKKQLLGEYGHSSARLHYGDDVDDAINALTLQIDRLHMDEFTHLPARFFAVKLLEDDAALSGYPQFAPVLPLVQEQLAHLSEVHRIKADTFIANCRHAMIAQACEGVISGAKASLTKTERADRIITNKYLGIPLFLLVMYLMFWFTFTCAEPFMGFIENFFSWTSAWIGRVWPEGNLSVLRSLLLDGVIGGVGGVIVFLPNILFMFLAIAFLEGSGYMSRAAFVMDGLMRRFGLQGKSFVPLVLGFGCTVPAIMATRSIESQRDRITTIMVLPLMSCGARLPIYTMFIAAFFRDRYPSLVMLGMYVLGVIIAMAGAFILKRTLFKGEGEVFLMELPSYRLPSMRSMLLHMWDNGKMYLHKAATIILFSSIVLYICNTYPRKEIFDKDYDAEIQAVQKVMSVTEAEARLLHAAGYIDANTGEALAKGELPKGIPVAKLSSLSTVTPDAIKAAAAKVCNLQNAVAALENEKAAEAMAYTMTGRIGRFLEPAFRPLGFDWRGATSCVGALAAKEVFVSQMSILFAEGKGGEGSDSMRAKLVQAYTPLQAACMMIFCLLSVPCCATLATIRKETHSTKLAVYDGVGLLILAYILTLIIYQVGIHIV